MNDIMSILGVVIGTISLLFGIYWGYIKPRIQKKPNIILSKSIRKVKREYGVNSKEGYETFITLKNIGNRNAYDTRFSVELPGGAEFEDLNIGDFIIDVREDVDVKNANPDSGRKRNEKNKKIVFLNHILYSKNNFDPSPISFFSTTLPIINEPWYHEQKGTEPFLFPNVNN